jgi:DNA-binding MarR family transcriptional regulator
MSDLLDHLGPLLGRAHEAHRALAVAALAPAGLSPKGFGALSVLAAEGPLPQGRLAARQGIDRTTMVAVVDELERLGAVRRRRDERDRRAYALEVTPVGAELLERARGLEAEAEERFLAALAPADRRVLKAALRTLVESAGDPQTARA